MSKKAQGISINTIIIAAIALIVLVILVMIFTGRMGIFGKDISAIGNKYCVKSTYDSLNADQRARASTVDGTIEDETVGCGDNTQIFGSFKDVGPTQICCTI